LIPASTVSVSQRIKLGDGASAHEPKARGLHPRLLEASLPPSYTGRRMEPSPSPSPEIRGEDWGEEAGKGSVARRQARFLLPNPLPASLIPLGEEGKPLASLTPLATLGRSSAPPRGER